VTNPEKESLLKIQFEKGEIVAVNGEKFDDHIKAIQKILAIVLFLSLILDLTLR
jgi:argininosuccinate synthase